MSDLGPSSAADTFRGPIESITANRSTAGVLFFAGLAGAIWERLGLRGRIHARIERDLRGRGGRPFWKLRPLQIASRWPWCCWRRSPPSRSC